MRRSGLCLSRDGRPAPKTGPYPPATQAGMVTGILAPGRFWTGCGSRSRVLEPVYHSVYHGLRELRLIRAIMNSGQRKSPLI
jgi:hypothetical protein